MASGDITLPAPVQRTLLGLQIQQVILRGNELVAYFSDSLGVTWRCTARNGQCEAFDAAAGTTSAPTVATAFTDAITAFLGAGANGPNARRTALVTQLQASGLANAGTVA